MLDWHKVFGIALVDFFTGTCWEVELEKDLSLKSQFLDIVIIKKSTGKSADILPDGFENLARHNLITYKSLNQPLDTWAIKELIGHYVNYRKYICLTPETMEPEENFNFYGICTRFPEKMSKKIKFYEKGKGIYDVIWGDMPIRIIVLSQISQKEQNAIWNIFSGTPEIVGKGAKNYKNRSQQTSRALLSELFERYKLEGLDMPYTMEDFKRDVARDFLHTLPLDERLKGLAPDERLKGLAPDERLKGLAPDERLKGLAPDERLKGLAPDERLKGLAPDERLRGLSPEDIRAYLAKIDASFIN